MFIKTIYLTVTHRYAPNNCCLLIGVGCTFSILQCSDFFSQYSRVLQKLLEKNHSSNNKVFFLYKKLSPSFQKFQGFLPPPYLGPSEKGRGLVLLALPWSLGKGQKVLATPASRTFPFGKGWGSVTAL